MTLVSFRIKTSCINQWNYLKTLKRTFLANFAITLANFAVNLRDASQLKTKLRLLLILLRKP